jgi:hypothetical protein
MATLILSAALANVTFTFGTTSAAAAAAGAGLTLSGSTVGALLGALVDVRLFGPGTSTFPGQKVDDLQVSGASQGRPIPMIYGREVRVPGTYIYLSNLIKEAKAVEVGGKGGSSTATTTKFTYYVDCAIHFCDGSANRIRKLYADGKVVYKEGGEAPEIVTSDQISFDKREVPAGSGLFEYYIESTATGPNLIALFVSGTPPILVSGSAANDGSYQVLGGSGFSDGRTELEVDGPLLVEAAGATVTLSQALIGFSLGTADNITIHKAGAANAPDSFLQGVHGVNYTPAFRDSVYVVIERLNLSGRFGNRPPNFEALVEQSSIATPHGVMSEILTFRGGLSPADYAIDTWETDDGGGPVDDPFLGVKFLGVVTPAEMLGLLLVAYDGVVRETNAVLEVKRRNNLDVVTLTADELGAGAGTEVPPLPMEKVIPDPRDRVGAALLQYSSPTAEWQTGEAEYHVPGEQDAEVEPLDLRALTLADDLAECIVQRMVWELRSQSIQAETIRLMPERITVQEGDRLLVPVDWIKPSGGHDRVLARVVDRSPGFIVEARGALEDPASTFHPGCTAPEGPGGDELYLPPGVKIWVFQLPPLTTGQADAVPRVGLTGSTAIYGEKYIGGLWYWAFDPARTTFVAFAQYPELATMGRTLTVLPAPPNGNYHVFDHTSTVDVVLWNGGLSSTSEYGVLQGTNWFLIGNEVVGAAFVAIIDTNTYRLSGLLRGRRDTHDQMSNHGDAQRVVLLTDPDVLFQEYDAASIGQKRHYQLVPVGGDPPAIGVAQEKTMTAKNLWPFSPSNVVGTRDGSNDLTIEFNRRDRNPTSLLVGNFIPLSESGAEAEVDILSGPGGSVLRTFTQVQYTTAGGNKAAQIYTAAQQTADGLTPGNPVTVKCYQISSTVGRGKGTERTI